MKPPARSQDSVARDKWIRDQVQEAIDDNRPAIDHDDVMKKAEARVEAMRGTGTQQKNER